MYGAPDNGIAEGGDPVDFNKTVRNGNFGKVLIVHSNSSNSPSTEATLGLKVQKVWKDEIGKYFLPTERPRKIGACVSKLR